MLCIINIGGQNIDVSYLQENGWMVSLETCLLETTWGDGFDVSDNGTISYIEKW